MKYNTVENRLIRSNFYFYFCFAGGENIYCLQGAEEETIIPLIFPQIMVELFFNH